MALSADRNTPILGQGGVPILTNYPVYTDTTIYKGALVALNASGYLVEGSTSSSLTCVGIAAEHVDNSTGASGAVNCQVVQAVGSFANGNSITLASVGALCYIVDDQTVSTNASGKSIAGTIYAVDANGVWVYVGIDGPIDAAALNTFITNMASTATAEGASLVGIADAGSVITGTTVETALQEIAKNAAAALAKPMVIPVVLSSATTGATVYTFTPTFNGKVQRLDGSVGVHVTTTACAATFTVAISAVASTATLAVTSTSLATLGAAVTGVTAASASFTAGQAITITAGSVTAFSEGQILLNLFLESA